MINIDIAIVGNESAAPSLPFVVENNVNTVTATYTFDTAWDGYTKTALFWTDTVSAIAVLLVDGACPFPHEVMATGEPVNFGVYGVTTGDGGETLRINSSPLILRLEEGTYRASTAPIDPTPDVYEQIIAIMTEQAADSAAALAAQAAAEAARDISVTAKDNSIIAQGLSEDARDAAKRSETNAAGSATSALSSAEGAEDSKDTAQHAMSDLLNMMGTDVATLVGGKIPMNQIPATATQEIHEITSADELTELTAQRGDLAEIVETLDGIRTITKTYQLLGDGDAAVLDNWVVWGTSYAVQAGNASTANNATDSTMINGHRLVFFDTVAEMEAAVKVDGTMYFAPYVEV